jgi:hypothetical protein
MECVMNRVAAPCLLVAAGIAALSAGCATDYSYSRLVGTRYHQAPIDTYPLQVLRVGTQEAPLNPRDWTLVEPGLHTVVVASYPTPTSRLGDEKTIQLEIAPCTQYYLVAVKPNRLSRDYDVRVDYQEPVPGCKPPTAKG